MYPSLAYSSQCSKKANATMGCLDTSRGRKFLHCITASWQGMICLYGLGIGCFLNVQVYIMCNAFWQNFEKITCRVQSKNKDQVNCFKTEFWLLKFESSRSRIWWILNFGCSVLISIVMFLIWRFAGQTLLLSPCKAYEQVTGSQPLSWCKKL